MKKPRSVIRLAMLVLVTLVGAGTLAAVAQATVSISRAEVSGDRLRMEGRALANRTITVDGVAMGTSDGSGNFRIERSGFRAPADCTVDVNDGSATPTSARLSGCTVSSTSPPPPSSEPPPPPPPSTTAPSLSSVAIEPGEVIQGSSATGTVRLSAAAPSGGVVVDLINDYPHIATVPASVLVPAGSSAANFPVATNPETTGSAIIEGTIGGVWSTHKYDIITTYTAFHFNNGSISIMFGGGGNGSVTSSPAGINCTTTNGTVTGTCSAFYPVGTVVRLEARVGSGSEFRGWSTNLPGCSDPSRVRIARGTNITCRPLFYPK